MHRHLNGVNIINSFNVAVHETLRNTQQFELEM
jgi:hypothetical protein